MSNKICADEAWYLIRMPLNADSVPERSDKSKRAIEHWLRVVSSERIKINAQEVQHYHRRAADQVQAIMVGRLVHQALDSSEYIC